MAVVAPLQQANAITATTTLSPEDQAKSFAAYKWARNCLNGGFFSGAVGQGKGTGTIKQQDANTFKWFLSGFNNVSTAGVINIASGSIAGAPGDGDINCGADDGVALLQKAVTTYWGYADGASFLCDLGFTRQVGADCSSISVTGDNAFKTPGNLDTAMDTLWTSKLGNSATDLSSITGTGGEYMFYLDSFLTECGKASASGEYTIETFAPGATTPTPTRYTATNTTFAGDKGQVKLFQGTAMTCNQLAFKLTDANSAVVLGYQTYLVALAAGGTKTDNTCKAPGATVDASGKPCTVTSSSSCAIDGIGWILCPILTAGAGLADSAYGFLADSFLQTDPSLVNTNPDAKIADGKMVGRVCCTDR